MIKMSDDAYIKWLECQDFEKLTYTYLKAKNLEDDFEEFLFNKWKDEEADKSDYLYEMYKEFIELEKNDEVM